MKNFEVVTGYGELEKDEESGETYGCGDYHYIHIFDKDTGSVVVSFGDYYHDKGSEKLDGFWTGLQYSGVDYTCTHRDELAEGY